MIKIITYFFFFSSLYLHALEIDVAKFFGQNKISFDVKQGEDVIFSFDNIPKSENLTLWIKQEPMEWNAILNQNVKRHNFVWKAKTPGLYSFQVDLFRKGKKHSYYLGQTNVLADNLVKQIFYSPTATAIKINDPINLSIMPSAYALDNLEFAIFVSNNNQWEKYQDYKSLPINTILVRTEGRHDIEVHIRLKNNHYIQQKVWLSSFYFSNIQMRYAPLYRLLLADDFMIKNQNTLSEKIAYELYLSNYLLYLQFKNIPTINFRDYLLQWNNIQWIEEKDDILCIQLKNGSQYMYDLQKKMFFENGSPVIISLTLKNFENINKNFQQLSHFTEDEIITFSIFYSIYQGFNYGEVSVPDLLNKDGSCGTLSFITFKIFNLLNINTNFILINQREKTHLLIQVDLHKKKYMLDTSCGYIYASAIEDIVCNSAKISPLLLEQERNLDFLNLKNFFSNFNDLYISTAKLPSESVNLKINIDSYLIKNGIKNCGGTL